MSQKYNDVNILNTVLNNQENDELFQKFLNNMFTRSYDVYKKFLFSIKDMIDSKKLSLLIDNIREECGIDLRSLLSIDETYTKLGLDICIQFLDNFHYELPEAIVKALKDNNVNSIDGLENINPIIKNMKSKLKSIIKLLDYDTAENLIYKIYDIYKADIITKVLGVKNENE
jgi:hypothetical protein